MIYKLKAKLPACPSCENDELFLLFGVGIRCYCCDFKGDPSEFPDFCEAIA